MRLPNLPLEIFFLSINLKYFVSGLLIFKANKLVSNVPKKGLDIKSHEVVRAV